MEGNLNPQGGENGNRVKYTEIVFKNVLQNSCSIPIKLGTNHS
jgi:hypothetical protein